MNKTPLLLRFLYRTRLGRLLRHFFTSGRFNLFLGWLMRRWLSRFLIKPFVKKHGINADECSKSLSAYSSFNDFFIRKLAPGARPVDGSPATLVSPADSFASVVSLDEDATPLYIKGCHLSLNELVGNNRSPTSLRLSATTGTASGDNTKGTALIFRLAPQHYHRFHLPFGSQLSAPRTVHGTFESVNPVAYDVTAPPLHNERTLFEWIIPGHKPFLFVAVGALGVGSIHLTYNRKKNYHIKGEELGYFTFGGSTVLLIMPPGAVSIRPEILRASQQGKEFPLKMGEAIGKVIITKS